MGSSLNSKWGAVTAVNLACQSTPPALNKHVRAHDHTESHKPRRTKAWRRLGEGLGFNSRVM